MLTFFNAHADVSTIQLAQITNDTDESIAFIKVRLDHRSDILDFIYEKYEGGNQIGSKRIPIDFGREGFVLERLRNRDVVILRSIGLSEVNGGELEVDFLFNAISGARGIYGLSLERLGNDWFFSKNGTHISAIHLVANAHPGFGVIGIKKIIVK